MNNITFTGRIVRDFDLKQNEKGIDFVNFTVAVASSLKDEQGNRSTNFFDCVAWREQAKNIAKFFSKGKPIGICGEMNCRKYTGRDGNNHEKWAVTVRNFTFEADGEKQENQEKPANSVGGFKNLNIEEIKVEPIPLDELPF